MIVCTDVDVRRDVATGDVNGTGERIAEVEGATSYSSNPNSDYKVGAGGFDAETGTPEPMGGGDRTAALTLVFGGLVW